MNTELNDSQSRPQLRCMVSLLGEVKGYEGLLVFVKRLDLPLPGCVSTQPVVAVHVVTWRPN